MESEAAEIADPGVPEFEVKKTSFSEEATDPAPAEAMEETLPTVLERATRLLHGKLHTGKIDF